MKKKPKYKYMHTIDGKPALYWPKEQIVFASQTSYSAATLVDSIKQIHKNEISHFVWRKKQGMSCERDLGWVKVRVDI